LAAIIAKADENNGDKSVDQNVAAQLWVDVCAHARVFIISDLAARFKNNAGRPIWFLGIIDSTYTVKMPQKSLARILLEYIK
jgi:hypothetical protein